MAVAVTSNYVAAVSGTGPLANPFGGELEDLDTAWRQSLFDQSGSIPGGSKGWVIGLIGVTAIVSLAVFVAWWSARERRRIEAELREAALRIPKQIDVRGQAVNHRSRWRCQRGDPPRLGASRRVRSQ